MFATLRFPVLDFGGRGGVGRQVVFLISGFLLRQLQSVYSSGHSGFLLRQLQSVYTVKKDLKIQ